jgi:hypothetical protein
MALWLVGCGGDDEERDVMFPPPDTPTTTDFLTFVEQVLASTAENTDPVPIDSTAFTNVLVAGDPQPITAFLP